MKKQALLQELRDITQSNIKRAQHFESLPESVVRHKAYSNEWSVLECLDHLNRYGDFYLPEIERAISSAPASDEDRFESGWLGNKSAMSMLPQNGKLKKMKTFKNKNPTVDGLQPRSLQNFIKQQHSFLELINKAARVDLTKTKTATTLPLIHFRLGDTLRFVIYHNKRHMHQAERVLKTSKITA